MPGYREARPVRHTLFFRTTSASMAHNSGKSGEYAVWTIGGGSNPSSSPSRRGTQVEIALLVTEYSHFHSNIVHIQSNGIIGPLSAFLLKIRYYFPIVFFSKFLGETAIIFHQMEIELVVMLNLKRCSWLVAPREMRQLLAGSITA